MQLGFREIEKAFEVEEKILYRWINDRAMPAVKANGQFYFNSVEVVEWALKNKILLTPGALKLCEKSRGDFDVLTPALMQGGIYFGIDGNQSEEVLGNVLGALTLPEHIQKSYLKAMLLSREQVGATAIGNGIAIPHVKHPIIFSGMEPVVGLFFLKNQVDFAAFDGERVYILFLILSNSFKSHLSLLSHLAFCLQDEVVKFVLNRQASPEEILAAFQIVETKIPRIL